MLPGLSNVNSPTSTHPPAIRAGASIREVEGRLDVVSATVIQGDLGHAVDKLKQAPGKDILQYGYGPVTRTLIDQGLLDELRLWLHPILVGRGAVDDLLIGPRATATLKLADVKRYDSVLLILTYQPVSR